MNSKDKRAGRVVAVNQTNNGMVTCSVQLSHAGGQEENVPVGKPHAKVMWKPEPGWTVVVDYMEDGTPFITDVLSVPSKTFDAPQLAEGSMTFQFDDETAITVDKDSSGNYTVDISASGKVSVSSAEAVEVDGGSITLGTGGNDAALVTDVSTTTDGEGKVTDISLTKTSTTSAE